MNEKILASVQPLKAIDLDTKRYAGYAFFNLTKSKKKHYLNVVLKTKFYERGKLRDGGSYAIRIPIPSLSMMYNYIKDTIGISHTSKRSWEFKINED